MADSIPLWPGGAPDARGGAPHDAPALTPFPADVPHPAPALLVLPGGGYEYLSPREGEEFALWLNERGIHAFVLSYRLGKNGYRHPAMLQDAARGLRTLRHRAGEFGIAPGQIGIIGSSAGGHLAATLLTRFDAGDPAAADPVERLSSRPDLGVLCYPVITLSGPATHEGSRDQLLGAGAEEAQRLLLSADLHVTEQTPPCFVWHTQEDPYVPAENALLFARALQAKKVPYALHVYERGPHGLALGNHPWTAELLRWLSLRWPVRHAG
ncbi:MAG: alpha/beta hydrolase [Verrucomicrobium sp.]|nr:alpha/beta hydrolase [Verrucomicrobium sp.]